MLEELSTSENIAYRDRERSRITREMARRLMMTSFGFNDSGGGTTVPRLAAKELVRRGWDVTVFHAAVQPSRSGVPYDVLEWEEDGVRLVGVHNRPHLLFDLGNPLRELDDPPITAAFAQTLDRLQPDVVHFHNLHNLGAALIDEAAVRGLPSHFTTHNYWLICQRAYLMRGDGAMCPGPGDGTRCAACVGSADTLFHRRRLEEIRARATAGLTSILAVSGAVRRTLLGAGYSPEMVDVVRQAMPQETAVWDEVGRDRVPGRVSDRLTMAFLGSAYPHKGPQLLVEAAQRTSANVRIKIIGEVADRFAEHLRRLDVRGVTEMVGAFSPDAIGALLRGVDAVALPSMWWDCAPLAAAECRAARVPLLVPRLGGLPEAVTDGVDGLLFHALDADDLARAIDRLASEEGLLERMQASIEAPRLFADYVDTLESYYAGERPGRLEPGTTSPSNVAVRWKGDHGLPSSLSIINDRVSERLTGPVQTVNRDGSPASAPIAYGAAVEVHHQWPPDFSPAPTGALATIVPWEFGSVPSAWVEQINANVDELWVPSEFVRRMYVQDGVPADRVQVIPNGVDLELFRPAEAPSEERAGTRFLFVGGLIWRKGPDVLLEAWKRAFPGRADVTLVVKDFGADGVYAGGDRSAYREHAESGALPRIELMPQSMSTAQIAALYRSCDVLVHPYRGEGFGMPVLEAMASGMPVIVTSGGPTDEFCPPDAGWRIRSRPAPMDPQALGDFTPVSQPWILEPDLDHLVELLQAAAAEPSAQRHERGSAGRRAAEELSWDAVAGRYQARIAILAQRIPRTAVPDLEPFPFENEYERRVLATPAWRGTDRLNDLLRAWSSATTRDTDACLYLLADPATAGDPEAIEAFILAAAAGVDLAECGDIDVLMEPFQSTRDRRLLGSVDAFVPLHPGCAGYSDMAQRLGVNVVEPSNASISALLDGAGVGV